MVRTLTSFIFGVVIVPSVCSTSRHAIPRQPSSTASASPTGPPPTINTGILEFTGQVPARVSSGERAATIEARLGRPSASGLGGRVSFVGDVFVQLVDVFRFQLRAERVVVDAGVQGLGQDQQVAEVVIGRIANDTDRFLAG